MNLDSKAAQMLIKTVIGALGIDGEALLKNITDFQAYTLNQVKHHDMRLVGIESQLREFNGNITLLIQILTDEKEIQNAGHERSRNEPAIGSTGIKLIEQWRAESDPADGTCG